MEVTNETEADMEDAPVPSSATSETPPEEAEQPANKRVTRLSQRHAREASVDMLSDENGPNVASQGAYRTPQSGTSSSSSVSGAAARDSNTRKSKGDTPPLDEQIATVLRLAQTPQADGMKGYVMSAPWLKEAQERGTVANKSSKQVREEVLPKVDNRELILKIDGRVPDLTNEKGEKFYPLKLGQELGREIEVLPEEAWEKIVQWHGMEDGSPEIVRYCHNTSTGTGSENIQWELYPPVFTVFKLPWRDNGQPGNLGNSFNAKDKTIPPVQVVASRQELFQNFLRRAKDAAAIKPETRVRVWKIMGCIATKPAEGSMPTPAQSRSNSPAPTIPTLDLGDSLLLDLDTFLNLEPDTTREAITIKDETNNPNYNGHSNLDLAGLGQEGVIVLEEQVSGPAGGEFVSDSSNASKRSFKKNALYTSSSSLKIKSNAGSGRSSPAPTGMMTRGRAQRNGRTRGVVGLGNLGNTCYMNSALQCVRSVKELTYYFLEGRYKEELNPRNPLSHNGDVAKAYASLLREFYNLTTSSISPRQFKQTIGKYGPSFSGYGQQDSQEFLLFLLDGLQEDLNRIHKKPYIEKPDSTDEMVHDHQALRQMADRCWEIYKARNDSVITDLFAGMYKSTLHCPVCDKTSIIFDPFNNLTLQLPIENIWSRRCLYFPLRSRPVEIDVDLDKIGTWFSLKEFVAEKMGTDVRKLVVSEIYKHRFFKMFDDHISLGEERLAETDVISIFELDQIPTNYPPPKRKTQKVRSMLITTSQSDDEEDAAEEALLSETILVPVFNRTLKDPSSKYSSKILFAAPTYITLNRAEACDQDEILRKILGKIATLTSREILRERDERSEDGHEDEDMVVMNTEDTDSSSDSKINANSIQSEDGVVDVSMRDADESGPHISFPPAPKISKYVPRVLRPGEYIFPELRNLFDVSIFRSTENIVPTGWSTLQEEGKRFTTLQSRANKQAKLYNKKRGKSVGEHIKSRLYSGGNSESSEEDVDNTLPSPRSALRPQESEMNSEEEDGVQRNESSGSINGFSRFNKGTPRDGNGKLITYSRKGRRRGPFPCLDGAASDDDQSPSKEPLICLHEALILDWNGDSVQALFGGHSSDDDDAAVNDEFSHGVPTWEKAPLYSDPDLMKARALRKAKRKRGISLDDCLNEFGKEEILSENDAWYCPRCKEHRRASKKFELWTVPDILIVHLKRFSSEGRFRDKVDAHVDFPVEDLDINDRVIIKEEGRDLVYDLFGVDNHYGGLGGGHYTAFAKNFDDEAWYEYNDSIVSKKSPQPVVSSAAYILFYRRRSATALGGPTFEQIFNETDAPGDSSQSQSQSRAESPSGAGEGRRSGDSSRDFSSASHAAGAGAAPRAGNQAAGAGGQRAGHHLGKKAAAKNLRNNSNEEDDGDELPSYSADDPNPIQSMELDDEQEEEEEESTRPILHYGPDTQTWGFGGLGRGGMSSFASSGAGDGALDNDDDGLEDLYSEFPRGGGIRATPDEGDGDGDGAGDNDSMTANQDHEELVMDDDEEEWEGIKDDDEEPAAAVLPNDAGGEGEEEVAEIRLEGKDEH